MDNLGTALAYSKYEVNATSITLQLSFCGHENGYVAVRFEYGIVQGIPHHGHQCIHHSHENAQFEILTHRNFPGDPMQFDLTRFSCFMLGYFMQLLVSQRDLTVRKTVIVHSRQKVSF